MAGYPPPYPPPGPPPGYDPRAHRRFLRDQERAQRAQIRYQTRSMRRGSILGPVVMIAAGVVFLLVQTGRLDRERVWAWYGQWWPTLLVVGGLVVLAEWGLDQYLMRDALRPQYRRSLGGGFFVLLLFVLVGAGVIGHGARDFHDGFGRFFSGYNMDQDSLDALIGDKHESDQTLDFPSAGGRPLNVINPRGDVTISGTSEDNRVHVTLHKQVYASSDSDAESKAQQFSPASVNDLSTLTLTVPSLEGARADMVITVPASSPINVTANRGDVHVASIKNVVSVTANHGNVELSAIAGPSFVRSNSRDCSLAARGMVGAVTVQGHANDLTLADVTGAVSLSGDFFGRTHLERINGAVHFHTSRSDLQLGRLDGEADISNSDISADQVMGPLVLHTSNRNVSLDRVAGEIAVTTSNGTVDVTAAPTLGNALGNVSIEDRNGAVNVTLPEKAGFSVDARTSNGDFNTDFQLLSGGSERSRTLMGTVGAGGPVVRIVTSNSDVSIHKGDVQPLTGMRPASSNITLALPVMPATRAARGAKR
jgi:DUF4097 and DUF4098 domain-containing protein YvlB